MTLPHGGPVDSRLISLLWIEADAAEDVARMHAELFDPAWSVDSIRELLIHPGSSALVCKVKETVEAPPQPAGFVLGQFAADEAEILSIGVLPQFQRIGLGRRMLGGLVRAVLNAGAQRLFLEVALDNDAAIGLYKSDGFEEVGRRPGYYARPGADAMDALILSRDL